MKPQDSILTKLENSVAELKRLEEQKDPVEKILAEARSKFWEILGPIPQENIKELSTRIEALEKNAKLRAQSATMFNSTGRYNNE